MKFFALSAIFFISSVNPATSLAMSIGLSFFSRSVMFLLGKYAKILSAGFNLPEIIFENCCSPSVDFSNNSKLFKTSIYSSPRASPTLNLPSLDIYT